MPKIYFLLPFLMLTTSALAQTSHPKIFTTTLTYPEVISSYRRLDIESNNGKLLEIGKADGGQIMYAYILHIGGCSSLNDAQRIAKTKPVLFINNAIHAGEPDGVDASIELVRTLQKNPKLLPANLLLVIIPAYNVDGMMNRNSTSRVNQNGPEEYGFRANALNLDLNRDFIKADAKATRIWEMLFQQLHPDVYVDTHVSNGADYQYTMTLISTQKDKLHPLTSAYMTDTIEPKLYNGMQKKGWPMSPYVETFGATPETGLTGFLETPRFSTGYAALFNCMAFVTETHMWKPYNDRVWATYDLLLLFVDLMRQSGARIKTIHQQADALTADQQHFALNWELDTTKEQTISFLGYEARYKASLISAKDRLYYDRKAPYQKQIPWFNTYNATQFVDKPWCYVIPQAWANVIERLQLNGVDMQQLSRDTVLTAEVSYIESYQTTSKPYEGHYLHSAIQTNRSTTTIACHAGDYIVRTNQISNRYIIETLEPEAGNSFFAWNFFDAILMQKEGFSDYIFEEKAEEILAQNPQLKEELEFERTRDTALANNHWMQLNFIYQRSIYKEKSHNRYPVIRIIQPIQLPVSTIKKQ